VPYSDAHPTGVPQHEWTPEVAAVAAGPAEAEPPVAAAIHSARDWPAGLPPMEAPVAVLASPHDQPSSAICGIRRNLARRSPRPTVTQILVPPLAPPHSHPAPTAPDFSVNVSGESNPQAQGDSEGHDAHPAAVQTPLTEETQAAAGIAGPESSNQPAASHPAINSGEDELQQSDTDSVGPERP